MLGGGPAPGAPTEAGPAGQHWLVVAQRWASASPASSSRDTEEKRPGAVSLSEGPRLAPSWPQGGGRRLVMGGVSLAVSVCICSKNNVAPFSNLQMPSLSCGVENPFHVLPRGAF